MAHGSMLDVHPPDLTNPRSTTAIVEFYVYCRGEDGARKGWH